MSWRSSVFPKNRWSTEKYSIKEMRVGEKYTEGYRDYFVKGTIDDEGKGANILYTLVYDLKTLGGHITSKEYATVFPNVVLDYDEKKYHKILKEPKCNTQMFLEEPEGEENG